MTLEATMIMLDNSSFAINGDYAPTRLESEIDSASLLIQAKLEASLQSSVGIGLMGGKQVEILCTMTSDSLKANSFLYGIKSHGVLHFTQALQIAALSLKHRANEAQKQRIVCFVGSKIQQDLQNLKILGKKLKKNNVAVDLICFGECSQEQKDKVQSFHKEVDKDANSHVMFLEPSGTPMSDKLLGSEIFGGRGAHDNHQAQEEADPQLAAAIRMSLEENQGRIPERAVLPAPIPIQEEAEPTEEELERLAIEMSLQQMENTQNISHGKQQVQNKEKPQKVEGENKTQQIKDSQPETEKPKQQSTSEQQLQKQEPSGNNPSASNPSASNPSQKAEEAAKNVNISPPSAVNTVAEEGKGECQKEQEQDK